MSTKKKAASAAGAALSKLGASKGGLARAAKLSPERRAEIGRAAIQKRWARRDGEHRDEKPAVEYSPMRRGADGRLTKCERLLRDAREVLDELGTDASTDSGLRKACLTAWEHVTEAIQAIGSPT